VTVYKFPVQEQSISARAGGLVSNMMNPWGRMMARKYGHSYFLKFQVVCFWVVMCADNKQFTQYLVKFMKLHCS